MTNHGFKSVMLPLIVALGLSVLLLIYGNTAIGSCIAACIT